MHTIPRQDIPPDFTYYRTGSRVFYEYCARYFKGIAQSVGVGYTFFRAIRILGLPFYSIVAEKVDANPYEYMHSLGIEHGVIFWAPIRQVEKPPGWFRLPRFLCISMLHASRTAFSVLDRPEYWTKWSPQARAHRRKILELQEQGTISIEQCTDPHEFLKIYQTLHLRDPYQPYLIQWCERVFSDTNMWRNLRVYLARVDGVVLAGAVYIDEGVTSEYFTSFYTDASRPYHLGIALMDRWFADSLALGMHYCDLDHMWDRGQHRVKKGYTQFKSGIADHDVYFHDMWVKIF